MKSSCANASCELCEIFHLNPWIPRDSCVYFSRSSFSAHYFQLSCDEFPCFCCFNITGTRSNSTFRSDWLAAMKSGCGHPWSHIKKCGFCTEQPNSCKMQEGCKVCFVFGKNRHFWNIHSYAYCIYICFKGMLHFLFGNLMVRYSHRTFAVCSLFEHGGRSREKTVGPKSHGKMKVLSFKP